MEKLERKLRIASEKRDALITSAKEAYEAALKSAEENYQAVKKSSAEKHECVFQSAYKEFNTAVDLPWIEYGAGNLSEQEYSAIYDPALRKYQAALNVDNAKKKAVEKSAQKAWDLAKEAALKTKISATEAAQKACETECKKAESEYEAYLETQKQMPKATWTYLQENGLGELALGMPLTDDLAEFIASTL